MKKYLLIPILFVAALATSYADCGCEKHEHKEKKSECAEKCEKECCEKKCCSKGESCCKKAKDAK